MQQSPSIDLLTFGDKFKTANIFLLLIEEEVNTLVCIFMYRRKRKEVKMMLWYITESCRKITNL